MLLQLLKVRLEMLVPWLLQLQVLLEMLRWQCRRVMRTAATGLRLHPAVLTLGRSVRTFA